MEGCKDCARLRKQLSPLEDADFTADFSMVEPVEWYREQQQGGRYIIDLSSTWFQAFGTKPNNSGLARLGRTLQAMGWTRTTMSGHTRFIMKQEDFDYAYRRT
jgi:hypothetical protein